MAKRHQGKYTYRTQFESALACETQEQADKWLKEEVAYLVKDSAVNDNKVLTAKEALEIIKQNLGYMAGYYDHETAQDIFRLFGAVHPVFGTATYHKDVSSEEAFQKGVEFGKQLQKN